MSAWERVGQPVGILVVLLVGLARAWVGRFSLDADGISYLDLSDAFARHDWHGFLNAYWSPLYPLLLGISRLFLPTSKHWELPSAHILNFGIYAVALGCFEFFYASLRKSLVPIDFHAEEDTPLFIPEAPVWALAHVLFLWVSVDLISIWGVCPDLCVSAFVYVAAGLILRFRRDDPGWKLAGVLGAVLGLSYWAKAVMFPLSFVFMAIALVPVSDVRIAAKRGWIMALTFAVTAGPLVAAISMQKHRFTFGDSGRINYAMFVSPGGVTRNWQGEPALGIEAAHPTRKVFSDPPVYEFAEPIGGTFPPWYDPSYWQEGRAPRFNLRAQLETVARHLLSYADLLLHEENALFAAVLTFILLNRKNACFAVRGTWPLLLMCGAGFGLYMLVHAETRFVGSYVAILWLALLGSLRVPNHLLRASGMLVWAVAAVLLVSVLDNTARAVREGGPYSAMRDIMLSDRLDSMGVHPGDRIAVIGGAGFYAARMSRVKIVAEIMGDDTPAFWRLNQERRQLVFQKFAESGAVMVLAPDPGPCVSSDPTWMKVNDEPFYVHHLSRF